MNWFQHLTRTDRDIRRMNRVKSNNAFISLPEQISTLIEMCPFKEDALTTSSPSISELESAKKSVQKKRFVKEEGRASAVVPYHKHKEQIQILQREFDIDSHWSRTRLQQIVQLTGLSLAKVRKWNWDRKKRELD